MGGDYSANRFGQGTGTAATSVFRPGDTKSMLDPFGFFGGKNRGTLPGFDPGSLNYQAGWTPEMALTPQAQDVASSYKVNQAPLQALEAQAMRSSASPWAMLQSNAIGNQTRAAQGQAAGQAAGAYGTARSQLAGQGGISTGARERLAQSGLRNLFSNQQQVAQQAQLARNQVSTQDEANRMQILQGLPGQELGYAQGQFQANQLPLQARQFDIGQQVGEAQRKQAFDLAQFEQQNQARAAQMQANATIKSAGKK